MPGTERRRDVGGWVAPGFGAVEEAFARNFAEHGELGAAFAVTRDGEPLVDLWGGVADEASGRPWERDTLVVIFSGTKGLVALCLLMLADRSELDLEAPVARYWPEFGAAGKGDIRLIDLATHSAKLPGLATATTHDDLVDPRQMAERLGAQSKESDPRAADVYHPLTYGWLCGEVIRRVDGRSVGQLFADEVARPLELEVWIGLPVEQEDRVATLRHAEGYGSSPYLSPATAAGDELVRRTWHNPPALAADQLPWNRADWHRAEIPGAGGVATARSMARLYGCLACGGELDGVRLLSRETLDRGRAELVRRRDPIQDQQQAFGTGFQLQTDERAMGPPQDAFGHGGAGGSIHCAWPSQRVGLSYAMNNMRDDEAVDPRSRALLDALYQAVAALG